MANRSFKSLDAGDIPPLLHVRDLHDSAVLPPALRHNYWFGAESAPNLTRSGISASPDGAYLAWIWRGKSVKIVDWRKSRRNRPRNHADPFLDANQAVQNYFDEVSTIDCNKLIFCISFGKLDGNSIRQCARPLNENFHKVLNFPSETGHILAAGCHGGGIEVWQVSTRTRIISLVDHKGPVRDVQFAPDGSLLLLSSSADGVLKLWDCQDDGNLLKTLTPAQTSKRAPVCAWSPDASLIAGTGQSVISAWDVADISIHRRKCPVVREFDGHYNFVNACAFSDDGTLLLSGGNDCLLILWSTAEASVLRVFRSVYPCASRFSAKEIGGPIESFAVLDAAFHPRGDRVTAVCADGTLRVWSLTDDADDPLSASVLADDKRPVGCVVIGRRHRRRRASKLGEESEEEEEVDDEEEGGAKIIVATSDASVQVFEHPGLDHPLSLQHLARNAFRRDRLHEDEDRLNDLPTRIRRFLTMEEFKPELRGECDCGSRYHPTIAFGDDKRAAASRISSAASLPASRGRF